MQTRHNIIIGDSRQMDYLEDQSVQLAITSPPYWQLKDYGTENQIGYHEDYETYINNLNLVWKECYRVLENGCRLCVNIGDQFARAVYYGIVLDITLLGWTFRSNLFDLHKRISP